jgi:molybdopterin converting factor small subunit
MSDGRQKSIEVQYFALLQEQRGCAGETVTTAAATPQELYAELKDRHAFSLSADALRVAVNDEFESWNVRLHDKDRVVFIQPVAGG